MRYRHNGAQPVYAPNSFSGPHADHGLQDPSWFVDGEIVRSAYTPHREDDDFVQPRTLWEQVLSATDQQHMVGNLVAHLMAGVRRDIIDRVLEYWRSVHPEISAGIARGLGVPMNPAA